MMSDSWHLPIAIGLALVNVLVIWAIAWRFEHKVEAVVAQHTTTLIATVMGRHDEAMRVAEHARGVALTLASGLRAVEVRVDKLEEVRRDRQPE